MMNSQRFLFVLILISLSILSFSACSTSTNNSWVLDGGSSVYFENRQMIRTKIVEGWNPSVGAPSGRANRKHCQAEFNIVINADGELVAFKFVQKSRFKTWNEELERAVKAAAPFGPMPAAILSNKGVVDFTYKVYVSDKD